MDNNTIANAILMSQGFCIPINSDNDAISVIDTFSQICQIDITAKDIINKIREISNNKIHVVTANTVNDDIHLTFVLDEDTCNENGVFSYVYNASYPIYSEFGYTFFSDDGGKVHRIG